MQKRESSMREENSYPQRRRTPSFSSTLLDAICNSIDESKPDLHVNQQQPPLNLNLKHTTFNEKRGNVRERMNLRQAVMIEDWMEKHSTTSSSSESIFSSSETDTTTFNYNNQRSKKPQNHRNSNVQQQQQQKLQPQPQVRDGGFARTKLRALKIYGELNQKVRQPISPGSRIASFLSSIFSSENVKKAKMCYVGAVEDVRFESRSHNNNKSNKSPCFSSSASSYSRRSCMTKTPSSARNNNNGVKRSVRFYPVSVILGEDNNSSQQQYSYHNEPTLLPLSSSVRTRNSSIKELKKKKNIDRVDYRDFYDSGEDEDDDDALSCSSSDLFELDHLIGGQRYQQELPVYETTNLETNKAIANGLRF